MLAYLQSLLATISADEDGQGLVEYSLILALIAVLAIAGLTLLGVNVVHLFTGLEPTL